jgi:hypothetical protein
MKTKFEPSAAAQSAFFSAFFDFFGKTTFNPEPQAAGLFFFLKIFI